MSGHKVKAQKPMFKNKIEKKTGVITCRALTQGFPVGAGVVIFAGRSPPPSRPRKGLTDSLGAGPAWHRFPPRVSICVAGMAGAIHFLSDILAPETARFPAFELGSSERDPKVQKDS